jgi:hypothetical protein
MALIVGLNASLDEIHTMRKECGRNEGKDKSKCKKKGKVVPVLN